MPIDIKQAVPISPNLAEHFVVPTVIGVRRLRFARGQQIHQLGLMLENGKTMWCPLAGTSVADQIAAAIEPMLET